MPQRLTLITHALHSGGAERVLARLASHWAEQGRQVTLITLDDEQTDRYPLHPAVRRVGLSLLRPSRSAPDALLSNWRRVRRLRAAVGASRPDVVVSFTDHMNVLTLLASCGARWPVVIAERSDPRRQRMGRGWELLRRWTYPRCSVAVVQTDAVGSYVRRLVGRRPVLTIPNAVALPEIPVELSDASAGRRPYLVAVGRLSDEKGFDLLIEAFARIADRHPEVDLTILGEGPRRAWLEEQAARRQVAARIRFPGWHDQPQTVLRHGLLFVLPSRWEGFPNALLEAMACGLAAVGFACDSGPTEIVRHGVDGLLVAPEDVAALADAIGHLLDNPDLRHRMGLRAREVVERFGCEDFFARWDQAVARTAGS
jgi:GalNAc-alpha-(1->4)-GalNAc-alpha-(1->3)-diNAcBac-PP-undecaprenol alpha-1,4-N-acetyl-D-galactosaminyltransferase